MHLWLDNTSCEVLGFNPHRSFQLAQRKLDTFLKMFSKSTTADEAQIYQFVGIHTELSMQCLFFQPKNISDLF